MHWEEWIYAETLRDGTMRMIDEILSEKRFLYQDKEQVSYWKKQFANVPTIVADNVAEYFLYDNNDGLASTIHREWSLEDFPCVTPPFPMCFIEWKIPDHSVRNNLQIIKEERTKGIYSNDQSVLLAMGTHLTTIDLHREHYPFLDQCDYAQLTEEEKFLHNKKITARWAKAINERKNVPVVLEKEVLNLMHHTNHIRWVVYAAIFEKFTGDGGVRAPDFGCVFFIEPSGRILHHNGNSAALMVVTNPAFVPFHDIKHVLANQFLLMYICFLTLSFCNCHNVTMAYAHASEKEKKTIKALCKQPAASYRVLNIDPMRTILRTEGRLDTEGMQRALHVCRGHFADYTQGKGLFGKLHGRFWIPDHERGNAEVGKIEKDYNIAL